jgi:hypothetical protein
VVPLWRDAERGVRVLRLTRPSEKEELVRLFESVAAAEGWQPEGALRRWRDRSLYFSLEVEGRLSGGIQVVLPDAAGSLPYQEIWPELPVGRPDRCVHVAVLALDEAVRGQTLLFWRLAVEMWRHAVAAGVTTLSLEVTPRVLPIYRRLGWPLEVRGELRPHWGEDCYLCALGVPEVAETLLRRAEHSDYYRQIIAQAFRMRLDRRDRRLRLSEAGISPPRRPRRGPARETGLPRDPPAPAS